MEGPRKRSFGSRRNGSIRSGAADGEEVLAEQAAGEQEPTRAASCSVLSRSVISRKELARELRRQAYQRAKQARANDPRHQAMKERAKQQRRELYQKAKQQRKAREAALDAQHGAERDAARAEAKRQLAERVRGAVGKASEPGRALARDIEHALQSAGVRELMERLRLESAALAAQHQLEERLAREDDGEGHFEADTAEHD
jgi:hypothetical protein